MAIEIFWTGADRKTLLSRVTPGWTWEEYDAAERRILAMMDSVEHEVGIVVDLEGATMPSSLLSNIEKIVWSRGLQHPRLALVVLAGGQPLARMAYDAARTVFREELTSKTLHVESCNEALAAITERLEYM